MTDFPAIKPSTLAVTPGTFPATLLETQSGRITAMRHSGAEVGIQWQPQFIGVTYAQWQEILEQFKEVGTTRSFLFTTTTLAAKYTPAGYRWWYAAEPSVSDVYGDLFNIQCSFRCDLAIQPLAPGGGDAYFLRGASAAYSPTPAAAPAAPSLAVLGLSSGIATDGFVEVSGVVARSTWQYSTDAGATWTTGSGAGFRLPAGDYGAGDVRVRQTTGGGTSTAAQNPSAFTVTPPGSVVIAFSAAAGAVTTGTVTLPLIGDLIWIRLQWPGWFTLYASAAAAAADASRAYNVAPHEGTGVCCDPRLLAGDSRLAGMNLLPFQNFKNEETPATGVYPWRHRNEDTVTRDYRIILQFRS